MHMSEPITPELILKGYCIGVFPMADWDGSIYWYSPDRRCILEFDRFRVPRSLRQTIRRGTFEIRVNTAFDEVIAACADRPEGTWISPQITRLYRELHRRGFVHSVETWRKGKLAGGLYGVAMGGAFFGESMFYRVSNASKVALVALIDRLRQRGFVLVDTQWSTPHLLRFGAVEITREEYLRRLSDALRLTCTFVDPNRPTRNS
jgi:leucyl/phenylalanyl-tRNA--protein transferase